MGKETGIAWTRSTRNLWTGCTKVGPGCDGCYAEAFQRWVRGKDPVSGEAANWGPGRPRISHLDGAFKDLRKWNAAALAEFQRGDTWITRPSIKRPASTFGRPFWPVFLNTQSDFFDNEAPQEWRELSYPVIEECENLTIFLVTKRVGNVKKMVPARWLERGFPVHVRLLITVVNQEEADRDIPKLLELPCKNGISYEPALGPVNWRELNTTPFRPYERHDALCGALGLRRLQWVIVGGESDQAGHKARPFDIDWARSAVKQCRAAGVPVFVKQFGSHAIWHGHSGPGEHWPQGTLKNDTGLGHFRVMLKDDAGADPAEWPEDLRVREFPE